MVQLVYFGVFIKKGLNYCIGAGECHSLDNVFLLGFLGCNAVVRSTPIGRERGVL